jgi:hypothetical protein
VLAMKVVAVSASWAEGHTMLALGLGTLLPASAVREAWKHACAVVCIMKRDLWRVLKEACACADGPRTGHSAAVG